MAYVALHWRVYTASFLALVFVLGAYLLASNGLNPSAAEASAETALLAAIAARDSDTDGLPDWEEALYGTSLSNPDSFGLGMTDGAAVSRGLVVPKSVADITTTLSATASGTIDGSLPPPSPSGTLTAAFSRTFLESYLAAKQAKGGADLSQDDIHAIADQVLTSLSTAVIPAPDFKTAKDLKVSGSGASALVAFAVSAEAILLKNTSDASKSEILYLQDVIQDNDASALPHMASIAKGYRDSALGLAVLLVPEELAATDLALINAMMRISEITTDFTRVNSDPLAAMLALYQYPNAVQALGTAFIDIGKIYQAAGVSLPEGAPGALFVNLITDVAASQAAATL